MALLLLVVEDLGNGLGSATVVDQSDDPGRRLAPVAHQGTLPGGLETMLLGGQKTPVVARRGIENTVVRRAEDRVRDDETTIGRTGDLAERTAANRELRSGRTD